MENLINGIILFTDKPTREGDFDSFGDTTGTVEKLACARSGYVRWTARLSAIPNAEFANMGLVNWSKCDTMLIKATLRLRYETRDDQLCHVLVSIR